MHETNVKMTVYMFTLYLFLCAQISKQYHSIIRTPIYVVLVQTYASLFSF